MVHVVDLQQEPHAGSQWNTLIAGQSQHLVVVHDSVHRLNPLSVNVTVQHNPLVLVGLVVGHVTVGDRHETLLPFTSAGVQVSIQLVSRHSLQHQASHQQLRMTAAI